MLKNGKRTPEALYRALAAAGVVSLLVLGGCDDTATDDEEQEPNSQWEEANPDAWLEQRTWRLVPGDNGLMQVYAFEFVSKDNGCYDFRERTYPLAALSQNTELPYATLGEAASSGEACVDDGAITIPDDGDRATVTVSRRSLEGQSVEVSSLVDRELGDVSFDPLTFNTSGAALLELNFEGGDNGVVLTQDAFRHVVDSLATQSLLAAPRLPQDSAGRAALTVKDYAGNGAELQGLYLEQGGACRPTTDSNDDGNEDSGPYKRRYLFVNGEQQLQIGQGFYSDDQCTTLTGHDLILMGSLRTESVSGVSWEDGAPAGMSDSVTGARITGKVRATLGGFSDYATVGESMDYGRVVDADDESAVLYGVDGDTASTNDPLVEEVSN